MMNEGYVLRFDPEKYYGLKPKPISYVEAMKKREMAMDNALEDARERVLRAAGIGRVEAYCINTVLEEMKRMGLEPESAEYKRISRETAKLVIRGRRGIWTRYYTDKLGLKDWILWKLGLKKETVFDKMEKMGMTGNVVEDMVLLTGGKKDADKGTD